MCPAMMLVLPMVHLARERTDAALKRETNRPSGMGILRDYVKRPEFIVHRKGIYGEELTHSG